MKDQMSLLSGVAASYASMPLSMLHQLQSVLTIEINQRLLSFVEVRVEKSVGNVGDVAEEKTVLSGQNLQQKSTSSVKLTVLKGGLK